MSRSLTALFVLGAFIAVLATSAKPALASEAAGMASGQVMTVGQELQDGPFTLVMQSDGNLVEYVSEPNGQSYPLWATGTSGNPGATAVMQTDGNFVVYLNGTPLWASGTYGHPGSGLVVWMNGAIFIANSSGMFWGVGQGPASGDFPQALPSGTSVLNPGYGIFDGQTVSAGNYQLAVQNDGNLVVYGPSGARWATGTNGNPGDWLVMQTDGNLVIYDAHGNPVWATGTNGNPGATAVMQTDSNFVIYSTSGQPLWASNSPPPSSFASGSYGYDVSNYECGEGLPPTHFGIVQVVGESLGGTNPCITSQVAWAGPYGLYIFLNYTTAASGAQVAQAAYAQAQAAGVNTNVSWWLDIETNPISAWADPATNAGFISSAIQGLQAEGVPSVGIYASPSDFGPVMGNTWFGVPLWLAWWTGSGPYNCANAGQWSGAPGPTTLTQYTDNANGYGLDGDYAC